MFYWTIFVREEVCIFLTQIETMLRQALFPPRIPECTSALSEQRQRAGGVTQILSVLHTVGQSLDNNVQSDMIYLDFAKAFDTVDHSALLA